jgi:hypothetical protein
LKVETYVSALYTENEYKLVCGLIGTNKAVATKTQLKLRKAVGDCSIEKTLCKHDTAKDSGSIWYAPTEKTKSCLELAAHIMEVAR